MITHIKTKSAFENKMVIKTFQPPQNENRSPSPVPANPLFKKCSVADMSPGVSLFLRFRQDFHGFMFVELCF